MKIDSLFIKFILVGILNTLWGYFVYALLLYLGIHYSFAVIVATILGILFNFKTTGVLVFKNHNNTLLFKFLIVYAIICVLNLICLKIAEFNNFNLYIAGFVVTCFMAILSFLMNKYWVFKKDEKN